MGNEYDSFAAEDSLKKQSSPSANPYDDLAAADLTAQKNQLQSSLHIATQANPEQAAKAKRLADVTGLPMDLVSRNEEKVAQQQRISEIQQQAAEDPILRRQLTDPDFAKIAHDDTANLSVVTKIAKSFQGMLRNAAAGATFDLGSSFYGLLETGAKVLAPLGDPLAGTILPENPLRRMAEGFEKARKNQQNMADVVAGGPATGGFVEQSISSGFRSVGQNALPIGASIVTGNPTYALAGGGINQGVQSSTKALDAGKTPLQALSYGVQDAAAEVVTEKLPLGVLLRDLKAGAGFGKVVLHQAATEIPTELAATAWQNANEWANLHPEKSIKDYLKELPEAEAQTVIATLTSVILTAGFGKTVNHVVQQRMNAQHADVNAQNLELLHKLAEASKVRERDTTSFANYANDATTEGPVQNVFVPAATFAQAAGENLETLKAAMPSVAQQFDQATQLGSDLVIPIGEFSAHVAGTGLDKTLMDHIRFEQDGMSRAEAQEFMQQKSEDFSKQAEQMLEEHELDTAHRESALTVEVELLKQLKDANRFSEDVNGAYAKLASAFYAVQAARLGITPEEMYVKYPLQITAQGLGNTNTMDQTSSNFQNWFKNSQVKDESGKPLVVYHGTTGDFNAFNPMHAGSNTLAFSGKAGFWFTSSDKHASDFASEKSGGNVMPVYLSMQNPLVVSNVNDEKGRMAAIDQAKKEKRDGVIFKNSEDTSKVNTRNTSDLYLAFNPEQVKSAVGNNGNFDPNTPNVLHQSMSTRVPTAVKASEDPMQDMLIIGLDAAMADPSAFAKNVALIAKYPNFPANVKTRSAVKRAEVFIDEVVNNLLWLFDQVPAGTRERSKLWYDGARAIVDQWTEKYDLNDAQVSGVLAVLSPQKDWFQNVSLAERVLDVVTTKQDHRWDDKMTKAATRILAKDGYAENVGEITGKTLGELEDTYLKAMWVRVYDEAHHPRSFRVIAPEGTFGDFVTNKDGKTPSRVGWGSFNEIGKAISIIENPGLDNISSMLGEQHKVRNFYNNIFDPTSQHGDVTIDTHAVAAALLRPLAGSSTEVLHNFGGGGAASSSVFGSKGTYGIYAEAYRRAAEARGVLPRELQSITWEAVRGLFSPEFKTEKNMAAVDAIWKEFRKGAITLDEARNQIVKRAGGITAPEWERSGAAASESPWASTYTGGIREAGVPGGRAGSNAGRARGADTRGAQYGQAPSGIQRGGAVRVGGLAEAQAIAEAAAQGAQKLNGLPEKPMLVAGEWYVPGPVGIAHTAAKNYADAAGLSFDPPRTYQKVDPDRAARIAQAFDEMKHDPQNPEVRAAYDAMIKETLAQWQAIKATGLKVEFITGEDPYGVSPRQAIMDVIENNHLWVFPTDSGFGSSDADISGNPLLAFTDEVIDGRRLKANDVFRIVHDYFGHIKDGNGFRADGEENAWRSHSAMYSPLARRAMTTETRGQNSWVNFGPHGAANQKASAADTVYADQKIGLLPEWVSEEGRHDNTLEQDNLEQPARGQITFGDDITQSPSVISLLQNADLSTFVHELGHFQLEVLSHIASQPEAPAEIVQDMDKLLKWFKVPGATSQERLMNWQSLSLEEKRPMHEQLARGFESYMFEGNAPNPELNGIFSRIRAWMINVYKQISSLNVELTDEVRGVFDRMIATNDQILAAEQERGYAPLFKSAEEMGVTQEEWKAYQEQGQEQTQAAVDQLQSQGLKDMRWTQNLRAKVMRKLQKQADQLRKGVENQVRAEVRKQPVYAVQRFLRYGEMPQEVLHGKGLELAGKLDLSALKEMYGEGPAALWRYLSVGENGLAAAEGLHPNLVAELFGFTSGDELVRQILAAEPEASVVEGLTDKRMLEEHGEFSDQDAIDRATDSAIQNDVRGRMIATELRALDKAMNPREKTEGGGSFNVLKKAAKRFADAIIARKKVRDVKPGYYSKAEAREGRAAEKAKGLIEKATHKRNQLVNHYAARAAYDALEEIQKGMAYLNKVSSNESIDIAYRDQIDQLLERFDLRSGQSLKAIDKRKSLADWIEQQEALGYDPVIDDTLRNEAFRKSYKEMTVEEVRGLIDAVKNIEHLGKLKAKLLTAKDDREFGEVVTNIAESIKANAKKSLPEERASDRGFLVSAKRLFRMAAAIHRKFASLARGFDGYTDGGVTWDNLVRNMNERGNYEASENEKATKHLMELFGTLNVGAKQLRQKQYFPLSGKSFSLEERIGIALNMGNEVNRERVQSGENLNDAQLNEILDTLDQSQWAFVQGVWDYFESFRPAIRDKERRVTGVEPTWVEANPVDTKFGQLRGGYYPIAYDPLRSEKSNADINAQVQRQIQQGLYTRAQTARGHLKERAESTGRPLRYDFADVIARHVTQVVHDLAWHEYLIDANRILRSETIEHAVKSHYGIEVLSEMKDALKDIAIGNMSTDKGAVFFNHLRYGTTIAGLAYNVFNTLQNLTGITQSMSRVGSKWIFKGMAHWAGDAASMESSVKKIHEKSDFMRTRAKTMLREISELRNKVQGKDSKITASFFWLQAKTQLMVDVPTWWGAYEKALSEDGMTEDTAVALADQAVIDAQGSGQIKDLAGVQRGNAGLKIFTTFYSFFNTTLNLTAEAAGRTDFKKPKEVALFAADMALLYFIPALLSTLLKAGLSADWDDKDKLLKKILGDQISYMLGTVVLVREAISGVQAATGTGEGFGYTGPASMRFMADLFKLGQQIHQGDADEPFWKALDNVGGVLFHYPAGQINRTASGIAALADGRTKNPLAVVMGAPPK